MTPARLMSDDERPWALRPFRRAALAKPWWNLLKTALQTALFWLIFLGVLPVALSSLEGALGWTPHQFPTQRWSPWLGFACLGALGLASGATMAWVGQGTPLPLDGTNRLVVVGPYRYVRNPMAIAGLGQGLCVGLWLGSWLAPLYVLAGGLLWNALARPPEELYLEREFGAPYLHYKARVRCWLPRLRPYSPDE